MGRLSKKAGVQATIVLDRTSGAILKTSGQISWIRSTKANGASSQAQSQAAFSTEANTSQPSEQQGAEELAALVWAFVKTAGTLVDEIDSEVSGLAFWLLPDWSDRN